jgi:transposase
MARSAGAHVPDHTVIARFRRRHVERLEAVFVRVLEMCRDAGLIRLGLAVLDGTKVKANASGGLSTPTRNHS